MSSRALRFLAPLGLAVAVAIFLSRSESAPHIPAPVLETSASAPAPAAASAQPAAQAASLDKPAAMPEAQPVLAAVKGQPAAQKPASARLVKRQRLVTLDRAAFEAFLARSAKNAAEELILPLFPDKTCTLRNLHLAARERGAAAYTGVAKEAPFGRVQFVYNDGALLATIDLGEGGLFAIESDPSGAQVVRELDRAAFLPCGADGAHELACRV